MASHPGDPTAEPERARALIEQVAPSGSLERGDAPFARACRGALIELTTR